MRARRPVQRPLGGPSGGLLGHQEAYPEAVWGARRPNVGFADSSNENVGFAQAAGRPGGREARRQGGQTAERPGGREARRQGGQAVRQLSSQVTKAPGLTARLLYK